MELMRSEKLLGLRFRREDMIISSEVAVEEVVVVVVDSMGQFWKGMGLFSSFL